LRGLGNGERERGGTEAVEVGVDQPPIKLVHAVFAFGDGWNTLLKVLVDSANAEGIRGLKLTPFLSFLIPKAPPRKASLAPSQKPLYRAKELLSSMLQSSIGEISWMDPVFAVSEATGMSPSSIRVLTTSSPGC
jgi:hypothetical protein